MAASTPPVQQQGTTNKAMLKAWIDNGDNHTRNIKADTTLHFLSKPQFTQSDIQEAVIYARQQFDGVGKRLELMSRLAHRQYPDKIYVIELGEFMDEHYDEDVCLFGKIVSDDDAIRTCDAHTRRKFPKTIATLARMTKLAQDELAKVQRAIGKAQDDD